MSARTWMIRGTTSAAGKSAVVAGPCRVLARRGVRVAPLNPQSTALNSAVPLVDIPLTGYEIHAGVSPGSAFRQPFARLDGAAFGEGQIIATYLHGVFETPTACSALLRWAGLQSVRIFDYLALREQNFERLADALEAHPDMPRAMQILGKIT